MYAGKETLKLLGMDYGQFRSFVRDVDRLEWAIKNDSNLLGLHGYLISLRTQGRMEEDILTLLPRLKKKGIAHPLAHALLYAFYNNYVDLTADPAKKAALLGHLQAFCQRWLEGVDPADDTGLLKALYNLHSQKR